jgi:adenine-specific DNA-methyltransferase
MIKYIGSKRRLVPVLSRICQASGARTALDLFTGTTRVAQAFKAQGVHVTAVDSARYAHTFARTYIETDAATTDAPALQAAVAHLNALPGKPGYVTETFSHQARYFQPHNAARIDAVRDAIDSEYAGSPLFPLLLTSLIEAADRVDSTTGVQMAYVKQWAPRSAKPLELRVPELLPGSGRAIRGDAVALTTSPATATATASAAAASASASAAASATDAGSATATDAGLGHFDLAYLDPPYNQHRYFTNYHVWETLVAWDAPEAYGVARKRLDARDPSTHSAFNSKRTMPAALASVVQSVDCDLLVLSYNNESWLGLEELEAICAARSGRTGHSGARRGGRSDNGVATLAFDSARYVGARIGIFDPSGRKVGRVSHLSNQELLVIAGEPRLVRRVVEAAEAGATTATSPTGATSARDAASAAATRTEPLASPLHAPLPAPTTAPTAASVAPSEVVGAGLVDRLQQAT